MSGNNKFLHTAALVISRSFDIYVVFPFLLLISFFLSLSSMPGSLVWFGLFMAVLVVVPVLGDIYLVRKGSIADWDLSHQTQRFIYITDASIVLFILAAISVLFSAPLIFQATAIIIFLIESLFSFVTYFWKISVHAELVTLFCIYAIVLINRDLWFLVFAIPMVFFARMYLKMHTFMQLLFGSGVSVVVCLTVLKLFRLY